MPVPRNTSEGPPGSADDRTTDLIRWAVFSCLLVPVVLLWYGTSLGGTAGTALGLAAVTAVCRVLLRQSERCAARVPAEERAPHTHHHRRPPRAGAGAHRGGRHTGGGSPVG
ncbi:MAG TPA: hypothetical protein VIU15_37010 [Streptomyces sp.]